VILGGLLFFIRTYDGSKMWFAVGFGTVAVIGRTLLDYHWSWTYYFPTP
jgi:hypothetical protein